MSTQSSANICPLHHQRSKVERSLRRKTQDYTSSGFTIESSSNPCRDTSFPIPFGPNACRMRNRYWEGALKKSRRPLREYGCRRWASCGPTIISSSTSRTSKSLAGTLDCYPPTYRGPSSAPFQKVSWNSMMALYPKDTVTESSGLQGSTSTPRSYWGSSSTSGSTANTVPFSLASTVLCCSSLASCLSF